MPNIVDANGVQFKTAAELTSYYVTGYQAIYGSDINTDPDSPNGQEIGLLVQATLDSQDMMAAVNAGMDPDQAIGVILDQRLSLNGIKRQQGTNTVTNVTLVNNAAVTLVGVDALSANPNALVYTIADDAGTLFQLVNSIIIAAAGTQVLAFQAASPGAVLTIPNTITNPITVALGVVSVNNPTTATSIGLTEEADSVVKIRRRKSTSINAQGYHDALVATLENINGLTTAIVWENDTTAASTGSAQPLAGNVPPYVPAGIPGNCMWAIVNGGDNPSIASAIYRKRNAGCGMLGQVSVTITQLDGTPFVVRWDVVTPQQLYIQLHLTTLDGGADSELNMANIAAQIAVLSAPPTTAPLALVANGAVNINQLMGLIQQIDPNCLAIPTVGDGFSLTQAAYANKLSPSQANYQFVIYALSSLGDVASSTNTLLNVLAGDVTSVHAQIAAGLTVYAYGAHIPNGITVSTAVGTTITLSGNTDAGFTAVQQNVTFSTMNLVTA